MIIKRLRDCSQFTAGDNSMLREILNPNAEDVDLHYSLAWAQVRPGEHTRPHTLTCSEVYYILQGEGVLSINNEERRVCKDDTILIPAGAVQSVENTGTEPLEFLCIVDPAWRPEVEHIIKQDG